MIEKHGCTLLMGNTVPRRVTDFGIIMLLICILQSRRQVGTSFGELKFLIKLRFFLWRLCRNNIPVRNLLRGKGVRTTIMCPMCGSDIEHLLHVFFYYEYAQRC